MPTTPNSIYCYGEVLWDVFPQGKLPGGAPMNVAIGLANWGVPSKMISCIGADDLGKDLLQFMQDHKVDTCLVQTHPRKKTGIVQVSADCQGQNSYEIVPDLAWDFITMNESLQRHLPTITALVFGSLVCRNEVSKNTLKQLLSSVPLKIFDVNLRSPFYNPQLITELLLLSDIVKMNEEELAIIAKWQQCSDTDMPSQIQSIAKHFSIQSLIVTKGAQGASVYHNGTLCHHKGFQVVVQDTVGSGDAFLAAFLFHYFQYKDIAKALEYACAAGALIAQYQGANPPITQQEVLQLCNRLK